MGVVLRVTFHALGERAFGPVHFLGTFFERGADHPADQVGQTELGVTEKACRPHGVEEGGGFELKMFPQEPQIIVGTMKNELAGSQGGEKSRQVYRDEWIQDHIPVGNADLDQAQLGRIGIKTVGLGIDGNPFCLLKVRQKRRQFFIAVYHRLQQSRTGAKTKAILQNLVDEPDRGMF